ncbi:MAG: PHP domain-containing protein, partial [Clostridia bacterium]|nr:PHP domain-containing protein [Clostridia bacterium]
MIRADMHIHTYYSDGIQSPDDVIAAAKANGVNLISVTDHDNMCGSLQVAKLAKQNSLLFVDGEEISAYDGDVKVHILGYGMDATCPAYLDFHKKLVDGAEERTADILKKLASGGINITIGEVKEQRFCKDAPLHAMYVAGAGAKKGYAGSPVDFYMRYLNHGRIGFSCIWRPSPEATVKCIKQCKGVASLAHPGRISLPKEGVISLIERLKAVGLDGIEVVYSGHTNSETQYYEELATRYGLLVTGGSDTHTPGG